MNREENTSRPRVPAPESAPPVTGGFNYSKKHDVLEISLDTKNKYI